MMMYLVINDVEINDSCNGSKIVNVGVNKIKKGSNDQR